MTKDGAVAENLSTGEVENISGRTPETDVGSKKHQSSRLQFSQEDLENPALADAIHRSNAAADRLDATKENIPKRRKKVRQRIYDEATGRAKTVSVYQEVDRPPNTKLRHDPLRMPLQRLEQEIHSEVHKVEQENVGVEAGHKGEELAERGLQLGKHGVRQAIEHQRQKPWRDMENAQRAFDQANAKFTYQKAVQENPDIAESNPVSRYLQKKRIQRRYIQQTRQARRTADATGKSFGGIKSSLQEFIQKVKQSKGYLVVILGIGVLLLFLIGGVSSCSVMAGSGISSFVSTSYLSEDKDMLDAESAYRAMEVDLQDRLRNYERTHSYDEYHFELDTIEHDPYVLISLLSALHDGLFTIDQVQGDLNRLFGLQYNLTETVETETRYRTETEIAQRPMRDPKTGKVLLDKKGQPIMEDYEVEVEAPYPYTICTVTLKNRNLSHIPVEILGEDGLSMYAAYMATLGNREDLFPNSSYVGKYSETPPKYEIPSEVLADETFSVLITEAEKYIGMPYVWGGSNPNTSFDCSGFICWSMGNSGVWNVGRTSAQGLYNLCTPVAKSNAQPGDLIFFKGTYDTPGISHVGLYVGAGKMLHCGDPIRYVDINTTYWQAHFYAFARPPYQ